MTTLLVAAYACSSSSSGDLCNPNSQLTSGTATLSGNGNDPSCPQTLPFGSTSGDDAGSDCQPTLSGTGNSCNATVNCTDADGVTITGSLAGSGGRISGTLDVTIPESGGTASCTYTLTGTYK